MYLKKLKLYCILICLMLETPFVIWHKYMCYIFFLHLLTLKLLQTCINFFLLPNTKEDILSVTQCILSEWWQNVHFWG